MLSYSQKFFRTLTESLKSTSSLDKEALEQFSVKILELLVMLSSILEMITTLLMLTEKRLNLLSLPILPRKTQQLSQYTKTRDTSSKMVTMSNSEKSKV